MVCIKNRYLRSCRYRFDGYQFSDPVSTKPNQFARQNGHFRAVASMTRTRSPSFSNHDRTTIQRFSPLLNCGSFIPPAHGRNHCSRKPKYTVTGSAESRSPPPPLEGFMNSCVPARETSEDGQGPFAPSPDVSAKIPLPLPGSRQPDCLRTGRSIPPCTCVPVRAWPRPRARCRVSWCCPGRPRLHPRSACSGGRAGSRCQSPAPPCR